MSRDTSSSRKPEGDVRLSKLLSKILRHQAESLGIPMGTDGYVLISDLFKLQQFRPHTIDDIRRVVENCAKQRFELKEDSELGIKIRARQGHSIASVADEELLEQIKSSDDILRCFHGTYLDAVDSIKHTGLNRMKRNHIHMTTGLPEEGSVISGMRSSCEVVVEVDIQSAMAAGIIFYRSGNNVILSQGINGVIPPQFLCDYILRPPRSSRK